MGVSVCVCGCVRARVRRPLWRHTEGASLARRCDAMGNVNNVVRVPGGPPPGARLPLPGSELALARRSAAALAFATKMGVGRPACA